MVVRGSRQNTVFVLGVRKGDYSVYNPLINYGAGRSNYKGIHMVQKANQRKQVDVVGEKAYIKYCFGLLWYSRWGS